MDAGSIRSRRPSSRVIEGARDRDAGDAAVRPSDGRRDRRSSCGELGLRTSRFGSIEDENSVTHEAVRIETARARLPQSALHELVRAVNSASRVPLWNTDALDSLIGAAGPRAASYGSFTPGIDRFDNRGSKSRPWRLLKWTRRSGCCSKCARTRLRGRACLGMGVPPRRAVVELLRARPPRSLWRRALRSPWPRAASRICSRSRARASPSTRRARRRSPRFTRPRARLRLHEADGALAAARACCSIRRFVAFAVAGMLSPRRRCHTFDARADGYCRGEGVVAFSLRRDGRVAEILRRRCSKTDRRGPDGTNGSSQRRLLRGEGRSRLERARGAARAALGDPIEMGSVADVMGRRAWPSVKANIGHLEAAAAASALAVLVAGGGAPRSCVLNPHLARFGVDVAVEAGASTERSRGLSSFGYSSTIGAGLGGIREVAGLGPARSRAVVAFARPCAHCCCSVRRARRFRACARACSRGCATRPFQVACSSRGRDRPRWRSRARAARSRAFASRDR